MEKGEQDCDKFLQQLDDMAANNNDV